MADIAFQEQLLTRLDVIIRLLLSQPRSEADATMTHMISRLDEMGLAPAVIAGIVGKRTNYVAAILSQRKKTQRKTQK